MFGRLRWIRDDIKRDLRDCNNESSRWFIMVFLLLNEKFNENLNNINGLKDYKKEMIEIVNRVDWVCWGILVWNRLTSVAIREIWYVNL